MTNETKVNEIAEEKVSELDTLKQRADLMGINYHPSIGLEKLKEKVNGQLNKDAIVEDDKASMNDDGKLPPIVEFLTNAEFSRLTLRRRRKNAGSLVRVRVVCMNPNKKDWEGEIFSVGSAKLGTFKKFVPFNAEDGWHIPQIMLDMIKERKCSVFHTVKGPKGEKMRKAKLVPEFSVEILPPLTKEELKDLAQKQAMAHSID